MLKFALALTLFLSGCVRISVWSESGVKCPDRDFDNGGSVEPALGFCKAGKGAYVSFNRVF